VWSGATLRECWEWQPFPSAYKSVLEGDQQLKEVLVKTERVSKKFDETWPLTIPEINKGEIFAPLGGSGSGKSTPAAHVGWVRAAYRRAHLPMVKISPICCPMGGRST
jgi:hypothetical protein